MTPNDIIRLSQLSKFDGLGDQIQKILFKNTVAFDQGYKLPDVVAELGLSARTLQRRLLEEGVTFSQINDEIVRYKCIHYIVAHPNSTPPELAQIIGFSDRTSFANAVKRWFGCSASTLIKSLKIAKVTSNNKLLWIDCGLMDDARQNMKDLHGQLKKSGVAKDMLTDINEIQKQMTKLNKKLQKYRR